MRKCRFCAEEIQDAAIVCKHCGRDLIPGRVAVRARAATPSPTIATVRPAESSYTAQTVVLVVTIALACLVWSRIGFGTAVLVGLLGLIVWLVLREAGTAATANGLYCTNCGTVGPAITRVKGSFGVELMLWLCFLAPGLIYSVWRMTTKERVCPKCGAAHMIPADSPKAIAALATKHVA